MKAILGIREALADKGRRACITCSFQADGMVVLRELIRIRPDIDVLFLDTGYHFPETLAYRDRMVRRWNLNIINLHAEENVPAFEARCGRLCTMDPTACCQARKVAPLMAALQNYDIWFTGLRRDQSPSRANLEVSEVHHLPSGKEITKVSPLTYWNWQDVLDYLWCFDIEMLPLYAQGYLSIGCAPCTSKPSDAENPRSGRWGGRKLECGIHTFDRKADVT